VRLKRPALSGWALIQLCRERPLVRACIESIFWTLKDRLGLERHNARSLHGLRTRIAAKLLALAASVWLNHYLGDRPTRTIADLSR
jgi:hypothetical protein